MTPRDEIESLMLQTAQGDRAAFRVLYERTCAKLFGVVLRVLNDRAEAEDVLQDVYVKIWHNAARYQVTGLSPITWFVTIARNAAIDRWRKLGRTEGTAPLEERIADPVAGPESHAIASSERRRLTACLEELENARAEAVRRAYLEGETYADLAARFDVPLNTMRTWLRRSLLKLRECLSR